MSGKRVIDVKKREAAELVKAYRDVPTECFGGDQVTAAMDQDVNRPGCHGARPPGCQHSIQTAVLDVSRMNSRILQGNVQQLISVPRIAGCNRTCQQDS
jgi:hypothetical protein